MPKRVDVGAQREAIRRAARRVFGRHGVAGTGLAHVAEAAGMGRSSLYHYYPDKDALLRDLVAQLLDEEEALFRSVLRSQGPPLQRIERLLQALVASFDEWAASGRLLLDLRLRDARRFAPFFRRVRGELAAVIAEAQGRGEVDATLDAELAAATWIGTVDGLLLQHVVDARAFSDRDALAAALAALARKALAP